MLIGCPLSQIGLFPFSFQFQRSSTGQRGGPNLYRRTLLYRRRGEWTTDQKRREGCTVVRRKKEGYPAVSACWGPRRGQRVAMMRDEGQRSSEPTFGFVLCRVYEVVMERSAPRAQHRSKPPREERVEQQNDNIAREQRLDCRQ